MTGWLRNVFGADKSKDAATEAAGIASGAQQEALDYLKETSRVPTQIRDQALTGLSSFYQVPGQAKTQDQLITEAQQSPLYTALMGSRARGEESILRNRSATGGLRSGGSQEDLYRFNKELEDDALLRSFEQLQQRDDYNRGLNLQGLTGLAGISGNENAIAGLTAGIGQTKAQGVTARAQAGNDALNNAFDTIIGIGRVAATAAYSDIRLKTDIRYLGDSLGHSWYRWKWNDEAAKLGLSGEAEGVLAHQVYEQYPDAVGVVGNYLVIDYSKLEIH